mgnify:CR=1 FL=1|jgi:uncharacterized protein YdbL (DUF1318 family)|tara:strand:+ start:2703 stop:3398 length:696 start_codon:yes stop_codon:yes gene_type:complete
MAFYLLKRKILHWLRCIFGISSALLVFFCALPFSSQWIDKLGHSYLQRHDHYWQNQASTSNVEAWQEFEALGDIGRHHRLTPLKNTLWYQLQPKLSLLPKPERKSLSKWAKKNQRILPMQLSYAQSFLPDHPEKALAIVAPLAASFPEHAATGEAYAALVHQVYQDAQARRLVASYQHQRQQASQRIANHRQPTPTDMPGKNANQTTSAAVTEPSLLNPQQYALLTQHLVQ